MKIWIDLTDFLNWRGNLTGIQRIQYNISKLYIDSGKDVHFFVYREQSRIFQEIQFDPADIVKAGIVLGDDGGQGRKLRIKHRIVEYGQKVIPSRMLLKIKGVYSLKKSLPKKENDCIFESEDIVLIMGGIWLGNFINDLEVCKQNKKFKLVHFIFDMIPSFFPGYVVEWLPKVFNSYNKKVFSISDGILAISESTAHDVRKFMDLHGISRSLKVQVVRIGEGIDTIASDQKSESLKAITGENYILSVSTVEGRKNHASLFYVVKEAKRQGISLPKIVVVGRDGWLTDDIRYVMKNDPDARKQIVFLNNVNDNELDWLYKHCLYTIFPSFYEGWGMPVAESLAYGKLCIASDMSSIPEIAGNMIDYFSPYDTGSILDCITRYLDPVELQKKEDIIRKSYHQTTWGDMFMDIDKFIDDISRDC